MDEAAKGDSLLLSMRILRLICESIFEGFLGFPMSKTLSKGLTPMLDQGSSCTLTITGGNIAYFIWHPHFLRFGVSEIPAKLQ